MAVRKTDSSEFDVPGDYLGELPAFVNFAINWLRQHPKRSTLDAATAAAMESGVGVPWGRGKWAEALPAIRKAAKDAGLANA